MQIKHLSVALGDTLEFVLLLDGVRVGATLGSVDELFTIWGVSFCCRNKNLLMVYSRQNFGNRLDVAESSLTSTNGEKGDGLVDTAERGDIDGLTTYGTSGTDTGRVFTGTAVDNGINSNLDGVLVGHDVDLIAHVSVVEQL